MEEGPHTGPGRPGVCEQRCAVLRCAKRGSCAACAEAAGEQSSGDCSLNACPPALLPQIAAGMRGQLYRKGMTGESSEGAPIDPHDPDLVAYWNFDEGEGYKVADGTGRGHDLVITSPPRWEVSPAGAAGVGPAGCCGGAAGPWNLPTLQKLKLLFRELLLFLTCMGSCMTSPLHPHPPPPSPQVVRWLAVCGNGVVEGLEECDDGGNEDGNGCSHDCKVGAAAASDSLAHSWVSHLCFSFQYRCAAVALS